MRSSARAGALEQASQLLQRGSVDEAHAALSSIVEHEPDNPEALGLFGIALAQRGDYATAANVLERAARLNPQNPGVHLNRGNVLRKLRRFDEAAACFRRSTALRPDAPAAHRQLGATLIDLGRYQEAVGALNRAATLQPDHAPTYLERARAARELGNNPAALFDVENALRLAPTDVEALLLSAAVKRVMGKREEALSDCERALAVDPGDWRLHNNRGVLLDELRRSEEALASFERSLELNPDNPDTFLNIGTALVGLKRGDEAIRKYDEVLALDPSDVAALNAKGVVFLAMRRFGEALENFDCAVARHPESVVSNFYRSFALLATGRLPEGFEAYEWRRRGDAFAALPRFEQPELKPGEDPRGKRLLLCGEQGLGDVLQFARFARSFADRGATVVLAVQAPLNRLMSSLGKDIMIVPPEGPAPEFDLTYPLLSAPHFLGTTMESIPAQTYLCAPDELVPAWRARLEPYSGDLRVGLAWSGNPQYVSDSTRSAAFDQLRVILDIPGVTFVNVQKDVRPGDEEALAKAGVLDFRGELTDFAETAALLSQLDLVIAVDTSIAHLAGALGKPVWILLSAVSDWRWLHGREDSPWYPTARLFRQENLGEWEPVFASVKARLSVFARELASGQ